MKKGPVRWAKVRVAPVTQTPGPVITCDDLPIVTQIPPQRLKRSKTPALSGDIHGIKGRGRPMTSISHTNRAAHIEKPMSSSWSPDSWSKATRTVARVDKTHTTSKTSRSPHQIVHEQVSCSRLRTVPSTRIRPKTASPHLAKPSTSHEEDTPGVGSAMTVTPVSDQKVSRVMNSRLRATSLAINIWNHKKPMNRNYRNIGHDDVIVMSTELLPHPWKLGRSRVIGRKHGDSEDSSRATKTTDGETTEDDPEADVESARRMSFSASIAMAMFSARIKQRLNHKRMEKERLRSEKELHRDDSEGPGSRPGSGWLAKYVRAIEAGLSADHLIQRAEDLRVPVSTRWARREREKIEAAMAEADMSSNVGGLPVSAHSQRLIQEELDNRVRDFLSKDLP